MGLLGWGHQYAVDAVAVHVDHLEAVAIPNDMLRRLRHVTEQVQHQPGKRLVGAACLLRKGGRSAEQFARDSGAEVGRIKTASQGYFSVGARDGDTCEDCGSSGSSSPYQKVRVVTTIDYDLG